ncbi:unnamed protein product [Prunus armeniaca]
MQRQAQQARVQTAQVEGLKRQKKMAAVDETPSAPIVPPATKVASAKPPRVWRPRQDNDPRGMEAVSVEPKAAALEGADEGIIDVYHGRDPSFSANGLSFLMEFHKDHLAINLYGMTPENREIVKLWNLEYLRRYFTVTPADTIFARDTLAKARQTLEEEVGTSDPLQTKAVTDDTIGTTRPMAEGPGNLLFGHEAEDDPALGIFYDDYDGILGMIEGKTLASGGREVNNEAGRGNQRKLKEVSMNMVLVLPTEFSAPRGQTNGLDNDMAEDQLDQRPKTKEKLLAVAFNEVIPKDEPNKYRHLKPLYISAHVEGVPVSKVFVDCGATVNILPYSLMKKLDKSKEDLIPSDVVMSSFVGDKSKTIGVLPFKITVADQMRVAAFYVVESSMDYNILLGRDWIHQSGCIPSSLFQLLFFWDGQRVSIHPANKKPFETNAVQARIYDDDIGWVVLTGHDESGRPTRTTAQKVLELGAENVRQYWAREVLIDLTDL